MTRRSPGGYGHGASLRTLKAAPIDALSYWGMQLDGGCEISQENGTTPVGIPNGGTQKYVTDSFALVQNGAMVLTAGQSTDCPPGYQNSVFVTVNTADASIASGEYAYVSHKVEGLRMNRLAFGTAKACPLFLGIWFKAPATGTMPLVVSNGGARSFAAQVTINTNTWEFKTVRVPPDIAGAWAAGISLGLEVRIGLAAGSMYQIATGSWQSATAIGTAGGSNWVAATGTLYFTGLILLPGLNGPTADEAHRLLRPALNERELCKRYFQKFNFMLFTASYVNYLVPNALLSPPMRSTPVGFDNIGGATNLFHSSGAISFTYSSHTFGFIDESAPTNWVFNGLSPTLFTVGFLYGMQFFGLSARL
jgi:hypothetical protein